VVLLSTTHILKSQSQVGITAGRSRSGFCLIWSVTAVRGWSPLVIAAVRGCPSSFNLVSELPNTVKQHFNTVRHCLQPFAAVRCCPPLSTTVRRRPPPSPTQFRPETTGFELPLRATANPAGVAGSAVVTRLHARQLCSLQSGACRPRAAFQSPVRRRATSVAVAGASSTRFDPQISVPVKSSSTSCGNRHLQIRKLSLFHCFPRSFLFLFILLIISWPLDVLGVLFHSPEAPASCPRN